VTTEQADGWAEAVATSFVEEPGRGIGRDISKGEWVETEIDRLIELRHEKRIATEGERRELEDWQISEKREEAKRREKNRAVWIAHYETQARRIEVVLGSLVTKYREEADT
jgi:hypothetical protein